MSDAPSLVVAPAPISSDSDSGAPSSLEDGLLGRLDALRGELVELAFTLELRGRIEAADVASTTAARLGELCAEFEAESPESSLLSGVVQAAGGNSRATASRR